MDLSKVDDLEFDGIDSKDHPDYSDAYICRGCYDGKEMTEEQIEDLNYNEREFVYEALMNYLF